MVVGADMIDLTDNTTSATVIVVSIILALSFIIAAGIDTANDKRHTEEDNAMFSKGCIIAKNNYVRRMREWKCPNSVMLEQAEESK